MIKYENPTDVQDKPVPKNTDTADIHRLENLAVVQNQKIENLEREVRRLKNELRTAVSAFNQTRRNNV
jgi:polyhydroxyalkanoate synthesis regulator phasin